MTRRRLLVDLCCMGGLLAAIGLLTQDAVGKPKSGKSATPSPKPSAGHTNRPLPGEPLLQTPPTPRPNTGTMMPPGAPPPPRPK